MSPFPDEAESPIREAVVGVLSGEEFRRVCYGAVERWGGPRVELPDDR